MKRPSTPLNDLGAVSLIFKGGKLAPKLVYFILKKELLNFVKHTPTPFNDLAPKLAYVIHRKELLNFCEIGPYTTFNDLGAASQTKELLNFRDSSPLHHTVHLLVLSRPVLTTSVTWEPLTCVRLMVSSVTSLQYTMPCAMCTSSAMAFSRPARTARYSARDGPSSRMSTRLAKMSSGSPPVPRGEGGGIVYVKRMNDWCVLGHDSALLRLYWVGDNLG